MAPVAQRVEIAHVKTLVKPGIDPRQSARDLARHKCLTPPRTLVVEQDPIAGVHPIAFEVHSDPIGIELGHPIGVARGRECSPSAGSPCTRP